MIEIKNNDIQSGLPYLSDSFQTLQDNAVLEIEKVKNNIIRRLPIHSVVEFQSRILLNKNSLSIIIYFERNIMGIDMFFIGLRFAINKRVLDVIENIPESEQKNILLNTINLLKKNYYFFYSCNGLETNINQPDTNTIQDNQNVFDNSQDALVYAYLLPSDERSGFDKMVIRIANRKVVMQENMTYHLFDQETGLTETALCFLKVYSTTIAFKRVSDYQVYLNSIKDPRIIKLRTNLIIDGNKYQTIYFITGDKKANKFDIMIDGLSYLEKMPMSNNWHLVKVIIDDVYYYDVYLNVFISSYGDKSFLKYHNILFKIYSKIDDIDAYYPTACAIKDTNKDIIGAMFAYINNNLINNKQEFYRYRFKRDAQGIMPYDILTREKMYTGRDGLLPIHENIDSAPPKYNGSQYMVYYSYFYFPIYSTNNTNPPKIQSIKTVINLSVNLDDITFNYENVANIDETQCCNLLLCYRPKETNHYVYEFNDNHI